MRVFIAEKPDMAAKIAKALALPHKKGNGYIETGEGIVTWCIGHIMKSFEPEDYNPSWEKWSFEQLPMLLEDWKIKVDPLKSKQFKIIKELLSTCSEVVNAGDPGREGQLIVDEVLAYLKFKKPVKRILLYSLDVKTIKKALTTMEDNKKFTPLYEAGICRGFADWLIGMNATRAYTLLAQKNGYKGVLSVGRVQSPILAIVVRRDEEIDNFKPHDYFTISSIFSKDDKSFNASWKPNQNTPLNVLDEEKRIIDKNFAINISNKIKNKSGTIIDYEEKEVKENQPLPFSLSKMQIYANNKWGMTAKETLDTCQSLYEKHELQTYPRTDCQYLPEIQITDGPEIVNNIGSSFNHLSHLIHKADFKIKSIAWDDSKLGDHFGLIPTKKVADLSLLNENEKRIYQAVCEKYLAQFFPICEVKNTTVSIDCEQEIFKASGRTILKQGWREIFTDISDDDSKNDDENEDQLFPILNKDDNVLCVNVKFNEKTTTPPARYTEATLLSALTNVHTLVSDPEQKKKLKEKKGIGQEATRTGIIENLFKRELLVRQGKKIISSSAARVLVKALPKKVIDPALTAVWEDALDKIAEGKLNPAMFKAKQNEWVVKLIEEAKNTTLDNIEQSVKSNTSSAKKTYSQSNSKPTSKSSAKKEKSCPTCKTGHLVKKTAKASGKEFFGCSTWPKCNYVEWPKSK